MEFEGEDGGFNHWNKMKCLIISVFHSVPGVPRGKMERFAGVDAQIYASH
jgi:hypothetical protein